MTVFDLCTPLIRHLFTVIPIGQSELFVVSYLHMNELVPQLIVTMSCLFNTSVEWLGVWQANIININGQLFKKFNITSSLALRCVSERLMFSLTFLPNETLVFVWAEEWNISELIIVGRCSRQGAGIFHCWCRLEISDPAWVSLVLEVIPWWVWTIFYLRFLMTSPLRWVIWTRLPIQIEPLFLVTENYIFDFSLLLSGNKTKDA